MHWARARDDGRRPRSEERKHELPLEEKNRKKIAAVDATREHGKQLFAEGKYEHACAVYERVRAKRERLRGAVRLTLTRVAKGVLIINGCYGMSDEEMERLGKMETLLNLNMAACKLKLKEFPRAVDLCKTVRPQAPA
jgi:hypothetical protein